MRDLHDTLRMYADLTIRVGLNLQPGQRLAIIGPLANGGVSLDATPLVRCLTETAYRAGAFSATTRRSPTFRYQTVMRTPDLMSPSYAVFCRKAIGKLRG